MITIETRSSPIFVAASVIWSSLPLMLFIGFVGAIVSLPALILAAMGAWLLVPIAVGLLVGPLWLGVAAATHRLLDDEPVSLRQLVGLAKDQVRTGLVVGLVYAFVVTSLIGVSQMSGGIWILPLGIDAIVLVLAVLALPAIGHLAVMRNRIGRDLWLDALAIAGASPLPTIGALVAVALLSGTIGTLAPIFLPALIGPAIVVFGALTRDFQERR